MEYKAVVAADLKLIDDGPGRIAGYASTYGNKDSDNDIVVKGAYAGTVDLFLRKGFVAWAHDWTKQIATPSVVREDDRGLYVEAEFHSDPESQAYRTKVKERLERGKEVSLSIGYQVKDSEWKDGARLLKDLQLYEWSIVAVPANEEAAATTVKSADPDSKATWDSSYVSNLPDSAFAVILPGGSKDDSGKTTPRSLRKLPHHKSDGSIDLPHLRAALSRLPQTTLSGDAKTKAETHLEKHANAEQIGDRGKGLYVDEPMENSYEDLSEDISENMIAQGFADPDDHVCTVATFPTYAYVSVCDEYGMGEPSYYRVDYTPDDLGDPVVSNPTAVEAQLVFQPLEQPGIQYAGHLERTLAVVRGWTTRTKSLADLRRDRKEGRTFSAANVARMTTVLQSVRDAMDEMDAMLTAAAPKEPQKAQEPDALRGVEFDLMARRLSLQRLEIAV